MKANAIIIIMVIAVLLFAICFREQLNAMLDAFITSNSSSSNNSPTMMDYYIYKHFFKMPIY